MEFDTVGRQPLAVGTRGGKLLLEFAVVEDFAFLSVDEQDFAWLQTTFFLDFRRFEIDYSGLTCHHHHIVVGDEVACRAQTVTVEHSAGIAAVAEKQCGRAVPRLHKDGVIFVEGFQVLADRVLIVERLRYEHRHSVRQAESRHNEKFQHVVERCGVAHVRLDDRTDVLDVAERRRRQHAFSRFHPCTVAADGVDLSVVCQEAEWLCEAPRRECVGAET